MRLEIHVINLGLAFRHAGITIPGHSLTFLPRNHVEPLVCEGVKGWTSCVLGPVTRDS